MTKCIIIDDEPNAIVLLEKYVRRFSSLELVATFRNPFKAVDFLVSEKIDLLLLDINMPGLSGLELVKSLNYRSSVIFTTAHLEYGAVSYDYDAVDYLVKPVTFERFAKAIAKLHELPHNSQPGLNPAQHIFLKTGNDFVKLEQDDIIMIEKNDNYLSYITPGQKVLVRGNISEVFNTISPLKFIRVHKSYVVAIKHITKISANRVLLHNTEIPLGESYKAHVEALLGIKK